MNKKYIDFVPSRVAKAPSAIATAKKPTGKKTVDSDVWAGAAKSRMVYEELVLEDDDLRIGAETFALRKEPKYGVIEDFQSKFVKTEVQKRPLSSGQPRDAKGDLAEAKSVKIAAKKLARPVEKPVEKSKQTEEKAEDKSKMKIPKSPFINQAKVAKRPLSKNVYERKVEPTKEEATGPVTIISKPEKDAKVGRVVAIILAVILGAAAGTVAFLLLPK